MYTPSREDFRAMSEKGTLVPVVRQIMGDILSPVLAYGQLDGAPYSFLLESVTGGEKIGRYSFLGVNPMWVFRSQGKHAELLDGETGAVLPLPEGNTPLDMLASLQSLYTAVDHPDLPRFSGGWVGYFGYDVIRQIENLPNPPARSMNLPDIYFGLYTTMLIFDHVNKVCRVVVYADLSQNDVDDAYDLAIEKIDAIMAKLSAPCALPVEDVPVVPEEEPVFRSNFKQEDFEAAVDSCKEYIRAGDAFQIVLSQRLEMDCSSSPFEIYRNLRVINPSPYMFYLQYPELQLVGSSPEIMVRVEDGRITVRPIAGTRPRGKTEEEDAALAADLLADPKERAEHTMLVDLGRNDVGRTSEYGSVELTDIMTIENYSHVMHIVSNVEGQLRGGLSAMDTFRACIPAGTVSGAPKVRAMEIIDEFEPDMRGPYAGAVGYFDFSGNMDTCITLRTILLHGGKAYVQAGAGLVADSVPASEYLETKNKAKALLRAIQVTENARGK